MKIIIIGGFLGSGKTSFLQELCRYMVGNSKTGKSEVKVAIIENEIGETGIDNKLLQSTGFNVRDIFAGCICCTLSVELTTGIKEIHENINPEWLIIEATGVAYPESIRKTIVKYLQLDAYILTIVDANRWRKLVRALTALLTGQLRDSKAVLINKTDLVDDKELEFVKTDVLSYNSDVKLITMSAKNGIGDDIIEDLLKNVEEGMKDE